MYQAQSIQKQKTEKKKRKREEIKKKSTKNQKKENEDTAVSNFRTGFGSRGDGHQRVI